METRKQILERIRVHLPMAADPTFELREELSLEHLGVTSVHLITLVLALQRDYGLRVDQVIEEGMPVTVSDLVTLVERERQAT